MVRILWTLATLAIVEFFIAPLGGDWFKATFPGGMPMLDHYQQGYVTILAIGFSCGAIVAHYWPSILGWRADEKQYRKDLVSDIGALRNHLAFITNAIDTGDNLPNFSDIEFLRNMVEAIELPLRERQFDVPWLNFDTDPVGYLQRYRDYLQVVGPVMAVGHYKEAKIAATKYVSALDPQLMRTDGLTARQKKRSRKLTKASRLAHERSS